MADPKERSSAQYILHARMGPVWRPLLTFGVGLMLALALDQTIRLLLPPEPTIEGVRGICRRCITIRYWLVGLP